MIATKAPWPPIDGGRVALLNTIDALAAFGHEITLVAPVSHELGDEEEISKELSLRCRPSLIRTQPAPAARVAWRALVEQNPLTIARHRVQAVQQRVTAELATTSYDVVHVEQVQALAQAEPAVEAGVPVVLRQQNLEHLLWVFSGRSRSPIIRCFFEKEAERLSGWEREALKRVDLTVALTAEDARLITELTDGMGRVVAIEAPFAGELPAFEEPLPGRPAVTMLASGRWQPNVDLVRTFVSQWWPVISRQVPGAVAHIFGQRPDVVLPETVVIHAAPQQSIEAFPPGAVVALSARHPTGVPMKGLEAWARGLVIVASPEAAISLGASDHKQLLVGNDAEGFARALNKLVDRPELYAELVAAGRQKLKQNHSAESVAQRLTEAYQSVIKTGKRNQRKDAKTQRRKEKGK